MAGSYVMVGSGDHHVIALHGWFGSALGWGHLPDQVAGHSVDNSDETAFGAYLESWARPEQSRPALLDRVKGIQVPVKVITGEYDPTQPAEFMEQAWLQVYPNSELEVLRGSGHYPMFETPVTLAVSVGEFLARG